MTSQEIDTSDSNDPIQERAEELFVRYITLRESGENVQPEELCANEPAVLSKLLELCTEVGQLGSDLTRAAQAGGASEVLTDARSSVFDGSGRKASLGSPSELLARLQDREEGTARYQLRGMVGRGGMGEVNEVWDLDLGRPLAMKRARSKAGSHDGRRFARFLEEAQVMGQLDHPGIVPVHELGVDREGAAFFTMKLVEGQTLSSVFEQVFSNSNSADWNLPRAIAVLQKVAESMAYAHERGVLHRDLKPDNVMVGRYGEVYVMDWGLARVLGSPEGRDVRLRGGLESEVDPTSAELPSATQDVDTERSRERANSGSTSLYTMDGDVVGTPAYMSPEQAAGMLEEIGPATDIYAVGAMLYHLLAGQCPFLRKGESIDNFALWRRAQSLSPESLGELAPEAPAELVAVAEKAMQRQSDRRYPHMSALADDLRAYLEGRVVTAHETGVWPELRKWVRRNRVLATTLGLLLVTVAGAWAVSASLKRQATKKAEEVLHLAALQDLAELRTEADGLWPLGVSGSENWWALQDWVERAEELVSRLPSYEAELGEIRKRGVHLGSAEIETERSEHPDYWALESVCLNQATFPELFESLEPRKATKNLPAALDLEQVQQAYDMIVDRQFELERRMPVVEWRFEDSLDRWWHAQLAQLVGEIKELRDSERGLINGISKEHGWGVRQRLEFVEQAAARLATQSSGSLETLWAETLRGIADERVSSFYRGYQLSQQDYLVPLGQNPATGLWEFVDIQTGNVPVRDLQSGEVVLTESSGVVFVLFPSGIYSFGAQKEDPNQPHYDPAIDPFLEGPVQHFPMDAFFIGKYELSQAQWIRMAGSDTSAYSATYRASVGWDDSLLNPVDSATWTEASRCLRRFGFDLPTEAQWEIAARGGTETPYWTGAEPESLHGIANLTDRSAVRTGAVATARNPLFDDGYPGSGPVDLLLPNPYGLYGVLGNIEEWCRDRYCTFSQEHLRPGDAESACFFTDTRTARGGSYSTSEAELRVTSQSNHAPSERSFVLGVRAMRPVR